MAGPSIPQDVAWRPGDLQRAFERASGLGEYDPHVLLRPARKTPWLLTLDRFFDADDVREMLELIGRKQWEDAQMGDGARVALRNSSHAWLPIPAPAQTGAPAVLERLARKVEHVVGIGRAHFESVQAVRYTRGQYYRRHHDVARTVPLDRNRTKWLRAAPMRILTAFLYLTDVASGGDTRFTLGPGAAAETVSVRPAPGRLVLFPNVLDAEPHVADYRTRHEAVTVADGLKYGVNVWVHLCPASGPSAAADAWACHLHGGKWHDDRYAQERSAERHGGHGGGNGGARGRAYEHALRDAAAEHTGTAHARRAPARGKRGRRKKQPIRHVEL